MTHSAHSWKKLENCKRKAQARNFSMFEILPRQLVMKWMLI